MTTTTLFAQWREQACTVLERDLDFRSARIPMSWWRRCYINNTLPADAAAIVATLFINRMSHGPRLRFLATRHGRELSAADERAIRRTVKRRGR